MNWILFLVSFLFGAAVAITAYLTQRRLGPFAFVLARLRAAPRTYVQVATMLWVVAAGLAALPLFAWAWPAETTASAVYYFILVPGIASTFVSNQVQRAP